MMFSKKSLSLPLLLSLSFALAACDGRKTPAGGDEGMLGTDDVTYVPNSTFRVETVSLNQVSVHKLDDEFKLPESKKFQFSACVTDTVTGSPIVSTSFAVGDGKAERVLKSDRSGCLIWDEFYKISPLQKERMLHFRRTVRGVSSFTGRVVVDLAMNPWEEAPSLYDLRRYTPPDLENNVEGLSFNSDLQNVGLGPASTPGSAEAFLADVSMTFTGHDKSATKITPLLTLKPAQKFRLRLEPKFVRRNLKNELVQLDLKGGEFKLRLVVLRDGSQENPKPEDLVAEYQGDIRVLHDGTATQDILLRVHDTSKILSRNRAVIILEPLGQAARVARIGVYGGFIGALKGEDAAVDLVSAEDKAALIAARITDLLAKVEESHRPLEIFQQNVKFAERKDASALVQEGLRAMSFSPYPNRPVPSSALPKLCQMVYKAGDKVTVKGWFGSEKEKSALPECQRNPRTYLAIGNFDFVEKLKGSPRNIPELTSVSPRKIEISRSLSWRKESSTSVGSKVSGSFDPLGLLTGFLGIKIGIGSEVYAAAELSKSTSQGVEASVSESQSFSVVRDAYELTADVRNCVVVQGVLEGRGFYVCSPKTAEKNFVERYYLVNYDVESSPFSDEGADNQWRLTIRGEQKYKDFEKVLTSDNSLLTLVKLNPLPDMEQSLVPDFRVNQVYPGVLSK